MYACFGLLRMNNIRDNRQASTKTSLPPCSCCVSGIHRERDRQRNHGSTRSTRPITVHERKAICKSQLEPIIENPGNTWGAEQAFGRLV